MELQGHEHKLIAPSHTRPGYQSLIVVVVSVTILADKSIPSHRVSEFNSFEAHSTWDAGGPLLVLGHQTRERAPNSIFVLFCCVKDESTSTAGATLLPGLGVAD